MGVSNPTSRPVSVPVSNPVQLGLPVLPSVADLIARWRAESDNITFNGSDVSGWADTSNSGTAHNLVQATADDQPTHDENPKFNGKSTVSFHGTAGDESFMTAPDAADFEFGQGSFMVVHVFKRPRVADFRVAWGKTDTGDGAHLRGFINGGHKLQLFWGSDVEAYTQSTALVPDDEVCTVGWGIDSITAGGQVLYLINGSLERINVTLAGTGSNAFDYRVNGDGTSSRARHPRDVAEMLVFNRGASAWTDAELEGIHNSYTKPYYGIAA